MLETNDYGNWSQILKEVLMDFDPLTKAEITAHPETQDYTMLRCRKCGAFYLPYLGHTKANCRKIATKNKIQSNATVMLGAYHDYYHKK